jgi:hypothetical protein
MCICLVRQATIYDNQHLGSHIGVTVHFTNEATEHSYGGVHCWSLLQPSHEQAYWCVMLTTVKTYRHLTGAADKSLRMPVHRVCRPAPGWLLAAGRATAMATPAW